MTRAGALPSSPASASTIGRHATPSSSLTLFSVAYGLWLFGIFAYFVPAATWNPVSRFDLTRAIVEHRTLSIDAFADNTGDRALAGGRWFTEKAPVASFLAVPAYTVFHATQQLRGERPEYAVFSTAAVPAQRVTVNGAFQRGLYVCSLSTAGVATAVMGVLLFHLLRRRCSNFAAWAGATATILGTPLLPYATSFYGHGVAAAFLVVAFWALFPDEPASRARVRVAGACLALAVGSEYLAAVPASVVALGWAWARPRDGRVRSLVDLAIGALPPVFLVGAYHTACFGAPWRTGYAFVVRPEFAAGHASGLLGLHLPTWEGIHGLLLGTRRGLFYLAPFTAVALAFWVARVIRRKDPAAAVALASFLALLLANGGYYMWWGGAAAGPRHLVPVLGFLAFGASVAFEGRGRLVIAVLALVSIANFVAITAVGLEGPDHGNLLTEYVYRRLASGKIASLSGASNLGIRLGLAPGATLGPLLLWLLLGGRFLARRLREWLPDPAAADA